MQKIINIITLGCSKNTVDSEKFAYIASQKGFKVVHNSQTLDFDIAVINTCGFINDAKIQSIDTIFNMVSLKLNKKIEKIVVFGCLSERYLNELKSEIPEVDIFLGNYNPYELLESISSSEEKDTLDKIYDRIFETANHYAYLKIAEGCNRKCSFCSIPLFKGNYISRDIDDIINEATHLSKIGVKEIILIAQDLSFYGYDKSKQLLLPELIDKLSAIDNIEWIRLHYLYPFAFPENIIDIIAENPKVCKYFDIPLQHISDNVLKKMNRACTKQQTYSLIDKIRNKVPEAAIRTTLMVGHPGEGKREFWELENFVNDVRFDRLGVFKYSEEEGTQAAKLFKDSVSDKEKQYRADRIMEIQSNISKKLNKNKIDKVFKVIVDEYDGENYIGRTEFDSPEVDNDVLFKSISKLNIGDIVDVKINNSNEYTLFGEKI